MPVRKATFGMSVALVGSILYLTLHYVTNSIYSIVKHPYMDEIFHVPQAQRYCQSNFTYYDPKLTTPPGLYLISYARIWIRDKLLKGRDNLICDTIDLRRTNHLIAVFIFFTLVLIQLTSENRPGLIRKVGFKRRILLTLNHATTLDLIYILINSIAITILPPLFFFNSLYYTDPGSLLFTLLSYTFSINDHHVLSSVSGLVSTTFRQTNIVWLFYSACLVIIRTFEESNRANPLSKPLIVKLIKRCTPYATVGCLFILFAIINNGIVIGDKDAHQPKLHLAQILYFLGFCSIFGSSWTFNPRIMKRFLYFTIRSPLTALIASVMIIYLILFGRYAHPYLLADNRHLTFYIWRRILDRHNSHLPLLLTPIYLMSSFSIWHHLRQRGCKRMILFILCTALVTVPNGLLEPRYFIIPFVLLRLNIETNLLSLSFEIAQELAINVGMHYLFLYKTFHWTDSPEVQRIMW